MAYEVAVAGGSGSRYHSHTVKYGPRLKSAVQVEHSLGTQTRDYLIATSHKVAGSVFRIYVAYHERQPVDSMVRHRHACHYLYVGTQTRSCHSQKTRLDARQSRSPDHSTCAGTHRAAVVVLVHQFHVAVAAGHTQVGRFGRHPHLAQRRVGIDQTPYPRIERTQSDSFHGFRRRPSKV